MATDPTLGMTVCRSKKSLYSGQGSILVLLPRELLQIDAELRSRIVISNLSGDFSPATETLYCCGEDCVLFCCFLDLAAREDEISGLQSTQPP
jgi:hypothetical protein